MSSTSRRGGSYSSSRGGSYISLGEGSSTSSRGGGLVSRASTAPCVLRGVPHPQEVGAVKVFDPVPPGHNVFVNVRLWRVFVMLNGVTMIYAYGFGDEAFGIHDFIKRLDNYGFEVFSPVARMGTVPAERFGGVVGRWWNKDSTRFSWCTHRLEVHPWSFLDLWDKMFSLGMGIPSSPL